MPKPRGGSLESVWLRDKGRCWICGNAVRQTDASRDHVKPKSRGGYNKAKNYRLAHRGCNSARGVLPVWVVHEVRTTLPTVCRARLVQAALLQRRRDDGEAARNAFLGVE